MLLPKIGLQNSLKRISSTISDFFRCTGSLSSSQVLQCHLSVMQINAEIATLIYCYIKFSLNNGLQ